MKTRKSLLTIVAATACCVVLVWASGSISGGQSTYELRPQVSIPEHRSDTARVIDAYERLMERYLDLTERNAEMIGTDIQSIAARLDSIDARLAELLTRTARIETALGLKGTSARAGNSGTNKTIAPDLDAQIEKPK